MKNTLLVFIAFIFIGCQSINNFVQEATKQPDPNMFNPVGDVANLQVDSMSVGSTFKKYVLIPHESVDPSGLQYQEFEKKMRFSLEKAGLIYDEKAPEIGIIFYYGIGAPKTTTKTFAVPIFGQTGYSSSHTYGYNYGSNYTQTTQYTPQVGVVGYSQGETTTTSYDRFLKLMAYDISKTKSEKKPVELWEINIVSTGPSNDMRRVFPYMSVASQFYVNRDNKQRQYIEIYDNNEKFVELQNLK